jgi:outer membrane protein TolC
MQRVDFRFVAVVLGAWLAGIGCAMRPGEVDFGDPDLACLQAYARQIEYPETTVCLIDDVQQTPPPLTLGDEGELRFRDVTLQEAIVTALSTAEVMRDLQGLVLTSPRNPDSLSVSSVQDPSIQAMDPNTGMEAALSRFDAQLAVRMFFENNDRALNNQFFGGGTRLLTQDLHDYSAELSKRTAAGGTFALRHNVEYDFNNAPGNDPVRNRPWDADFEAEFRQPLMRDAGVEVNRIAGPGSVPGQERGVVIARLNNDMVLADFEVGVRDFVNDVENVYWELYYAYRELDAHLAARDRALETWRRVHTLYVNGRRGGEAEKEAQAREQYFRLQEQVENSLSGRMIEPGPRETFQGTGGVQAMERRLRRLMGIPISDGDLLRPIDEPVMAKVLFDWNEITVEALSRRVELRRQQWLIKRREMELIAAQNYLKPTLDAVGRYRWRGLGAELLDAGQNPDDRFDNAYGTIFDGDFQEWQLGVEFSAPLGFRQGHAAVRQRELQMAREKAILGEQRSEILLLLSDAYAEVERTYIVSQTNYNRRLAARQQLDALEAVYEDADQNEKTRLLDLLLDAQRRLADAEIRYYRARVEYAFAIKEVHRQKGSLLDYNEIYLAEGPWPGKAYYDASRRDRRHNTPSCVSDYRIRHAPIVSAGVYAQDLGTGCP